MLLLYAILYFIGLCFLISLLFWFFVKGLNREKDIPLEDEEQMKKLRDHYCERGVKITKVSRNTGNNDIRILAVDRAGCCQLC